MDSLIKKKQILVELKSEIPKSSIDSAIRDDHSRRRHRPCGLTIHPGRGCTNGSLYCYVQDMGLGKEIKLSPLNGEELVASLLLNPWFIPGRYGTFLAFGSICDPLHPELSEKTFEYLDAIDRWLGNPCQISTKMEIEEATAQRLSNLEPMISPLVSIVTIKKARTLEPKASSPEDRLKAIRNMVRYVLKPMIFLRPIMPTIIECEAHEIMELGKQNGAEGVILGSLKVSIPIKHRLKKAGIDVEATLNREEVTPSRDKLVNLTIQGVKRRLREEVEEVGLIPFYSACCANAYNAGIPCQSLCWNTRFCTDCPNNCLEKIPKITEEAISRNVSRILQSEPRAINIDDYSVKISLPFTPEDREMDIAKTLLKTITRRRIEITS